MNVSRPRLKINISKLSIGGMEQAFLNFLNLSDIVKNSDTTVLIGYVTDAKLLEQIPKNIKYHIIAKKWNLFGKVHAMAYLFFAILQTSFSKNQYDYAISYSYQHASIAKLTRLESKNNIIFIHTNLIKSRNRKKLSRLLKKIKANNFSKIVCVSKDAKNAFLKLYPNCKNKTYAIQNFVNEEKIIKDSQEKINFQKKTTTFLNVCRHENDNNKKVSRILSATKRLKKDGHNFQVLLIGSGKEDKKYKKYIQDHDLSENVKMLGAKSNPFPYFKQSDAIIMSSAYEGYGLILDEACILNIPIISTNTGNAKEIISKGAGILCENSTEGIYKGMKTFLSTPHNYTFNFSAKKINARANRQLNTLIFH